MVALNHCHPESEPTASCVSEGPDRALSTYLPFTPETECPNQELRTEASAFLPDCRAYEMVSPVDKNGGDVVRGSIGPGDPDSYTQAAPDGNRITYSSLAGFGETEAGANFNQYLASRGEGGWSNGGIHPPITGHRVTRDLLDGYRQFFAFTPDLCQGWMVDYQTPAPAGGIDGHANLYRRQDCGPGAGELEALTDVAPPGGTEALYVDRKEGVEGVSADGRDALFVAKAKLTPEAPEETPEGTKLYDRFGGAIHLVSVKPNGAPSGGYLGGAESGNSWHNNLASAVSADGERVYWNAGKLYLRLHPAQPQSGFVDGAASGTGELTEGTPTVTALVSATGLAKLTAGSAVAPLQETTLGEFLAGQAVSAPGKIPSGTTIVSCSPACGKAATSLTLSKAATFTAESAPITSKGPQPFAVGQTIEAPGVVPSGTKIIAAEAGKLTLSANALQTTASPIALGSYSACSEPSGACTVPVSAAPAYFWAGSADGSRALYTEGSIESGKATLYEFDLGRYAAEPASASQPIAEEVEGVAGASRDLSRVYFVSREALAGAGANGEGEEAEAGADNLYLYERGEGGEASHAFVARLSPLDVGGKEPGSNLAPYDIAEQEPYLRATRVSPDGGTIAFDSRAPLTGYDNTDTSSGRPAVEVYIYSAADGRVRCASCNPSGGRPRTKLLKIPYTFPWSLGEPFWPTHVPAAAWLPTWEQSPYASRPLAADGARLFFNSYDALLPRDTNGQMDVYEWEAPGEGGCHEGGADYFARNGGCLYLISSGESPDESEFWEASEDGRDVFFTTESSLVAPDPGSVDLYDARVGGGFAYPGAAASCEGEACQSPAPAPESPTPASAALRGAGNVVEPPAKRRRCPAGRRRVRREGRTRCVKQRRARANRRGAR